MKPLLLETSQFDAKAQQLEVLARDWADRECTTFDDAVRRAEGEESENGSIWNMPVIDSKRVVSLLVELEPVLGCSLPPTLIRSGGYTTAGDLINDLLTKIRQRCRDSLTPDANASTLGHADAENLATRPSTI